MVISIGIDTVTISNVERFLHTDFAIIEAIFGVPIEKVKKQRDTGLLIRFQ